MSENSGTYYSVQMKLVIKKFHKTDLGGYKCISKNSIGDAEGNIRLYGKTLIILILEMNKNSKTIHKKLNLK